MFINLICMSIRIFKFHERYQINGHLSSNGYEYYFLKLSTTGVYCGECFTQ